MDQINVVAIGMIVIMSMILGILLCSLEIISQIKELRSELARRYTEQKHNEATRERMKSGLT